VKLWRALGELSSGRALGELWRALEKLWESSGELWRALRELWESSGRTLREF